MIRTTADKISYYRLIALWVISEAMLGGIIHGLKLPVSGLIVGSASVLCISLIGYYYPVKGAILKATIIVAIFKMMLSPHSPVAAYIAVFFQGLIGQLIFMNNNRFRMKCIVFGALALLESGIQRILVLTILFGMDMWKALDLFISGILGDRSDSVYSNIIIAAYVFIHLFVGILIGWFIGRLPRFKEDAINSKLYIPQDELKDLTNKNIIKRNKSKKPFLILFWIALVAIFIHAYFFPEYAILPSNLIVGIIFRSALIILTWVVIINPILLQFLYKWLEKKKDKFGEDIRQISELLPFTQALIKKSWQLSSNYSGLKRWRTFSRIIIFNSLPDGP